MKALMTGAAAMILLAVGSYFVLNQMGFSSANMNASSNVRLD